MSMNIQISICLNIQIDWFWLSLKTLKIRKSGFGLLVQRL
jgi:hypothetical protein